MTHLLLYSTLYVNSPDWKQDNPITDKTHSEWTIPILLTTIPSTKNKTKNPIENA